MFRVEDTTDFSVHSTMGLGIFPTPILSQMVLHQIIQYVGVKEMTVDGD